MCIYNLTVFYSSPTDVEIFDCGHVGSLLIKVLDVRDDFYRVQTVVMSHLGEKRLWDLSCPSVRPSALNNSAPTACIFIKFEEC